MSLQIPSQCPDSLHDVIREAMQRGARSFTFAPGSPTVRIHLEPEREYISQIRVFLAHATADKEWADDVAQNLSDIGFQVTYLPAGRVDLGDSEDAIASRLVDEVNQAHCLCLLFSRNSAAREWVALEFATAARAIGRVLMLRHPSVATIEDFEKPRFADKALLTVNYQILDYEDGDESMMKAARILINHPDEGVTDGSFRPLSVRERDLAKESVYRRHARLFLDNIVEYQERHVVDVLPFDWREFGLKVGDVPGAFNWFVRNHGRLNLAVQVARQRMKVSLVMVPTNAELRLWTDAPLVFALVIWKSEWDPEVDEVATHGLV
jgi:hypothetical protein